MLMFYSSCTKSISFKTPSGFSEYFYVRLSVYDTIPRALFPKLLCLPGYIYSGFRVAPLMELSTQFNAEYILIHFNDSRIVFLSAFSIALLYCYKTSYGPTSDTVVIQVIAFGLVKCLSLRLKSRLCTKFRL